MRVPFASKVFRRGALARQGRPEPLDERLQVTTPHEWIFVAGLGLALAALLGWAFFGRMERSVTVSAVLAKHGDRYAVVSPLAGNVVQILSDVGDMLEPGQPIARLRPAEAQRLARSSRQLIEIAEGGEAVAEIRGLIEDMRSMLGRIENVGLDGQFVVSPYGGELTSHRFVPGQWVSDGAVVAQVRADSDGPVSVLAFVTPATASRLAAGMEAQVRLLENGRIRPGMIEARVAEISVRPATPPQWMFDLGLSLPDRAHLVQLSPRDGLPLAGVPDGAAVSARIVVGTHAPIALLATGNGY